MDYAENLSLLFEDICRLQELAGISLTEEQAATKAVGVKLKGIAKVWYLPYGDDRIRDDRPWWTLVYFPKSIENKVRHRLADLQRTSEYTFFITDGDKEYPAGSISDRALKGMRQYSEINQLLTNNPDSKLLIIFCTPKEIEKDKQASYYHVSYSPLTSTEGLIPGAGNIKWKDRIYLWEDLRVAVYFAYHSFHVSTLPLNSFAYIYEVSNVGKVFHDYEERHTAVYVKHSIPLSDIKLIDKRQVK